LLGWEEKPITRSNFGRVYPFLTELHASWYIEKVKVVPGEFMGRLPLPWPSQGDGFKRGSGFCFATHSFSLVDTVRLLNVLTIRYRLNCTIQSHEGKPMLYIRKESMNTFREIDR